MRREREVLYELYSDLGVTKDASHDEIKKAYKSKANKYHPDKPGGNAEKFHAVALAYSVLSDQTRRSEYDKTGSTDKKQDPQYQAEQIIYMWFSEILEKDQMPLDIIADLKKRMDDCKDEFAKILNREKYRKKKFEGLIGRITHKKEKENIFDNLLKMKIIDCECKIEKTNEQLKIYELMRSLLYGYIDTAKKEKEQLFKNLSGVTIKYEF